MECQSRVCKVFCKCALGFRRRAWCETRELCCTAYAQGPARLADHCPRKQWGLGCCSCRCGPACCLTCQLPVSIQITHCEGEGGGKKERKKSRSILFFFQLIASTSVKCLDNPCYCKKAVLLLLVVSIWLHHK